VTRHPTFIARQRLGKHIPATINRVTSVAMQRRRQHAFPTVERLCFLRGPCKVVIKKGSVAGICSIELSRVRDASLPGYEPGSRRIELSSQLQNNGKTGIRCCQEGFMRNFKLQ
jgi:hypothetical protein